MDLKNLSSTVFLSTDSPYDKYFMFCMKLCYYMLLLQQNRSSVNYKLSLIFKILSLNHKVKIEQSLLYIRRPIEKLKILTQTKGTVFITCSLNWLHFNLSSIYRFN